MEGERGMKDPFADSVSILTGGASGIGLALGRQIAKRRAKLVVLADLDYARVQAAAGMLKKEGCPVRPAVLNVASASDVQAVIAETVGRCGRLDFMFNNAGLALCGEVRDLDLEHWRQVLDTNLWGVIHGTTAAYRVMLQQKRGHIINTASLGGLIPEPMACAYAAAKHAVVGLSTSLRAEAADLGVRISVVCPGFVQTRALECAQYVNIEKQAAIDELTSLGGISAERCASIILKGIAANKAIITDSRMTGLLWRLHRLSPALLESFLAKGVADLRALRVSSGTSG